jgi:hypothetical protein
MPKTSGGGGGGGANIFTTNQTNSGSVGLSLYIDLGTIPVGNKIWFGNLQATSPDKSITFEVRTNLATKNSGVDGDTQLLGSISASNRSGTVVLDMYKNNTLHTTSVLGSGVEKFWLKLKSKSSTPGSYLYSLNYTLE